MQLSLCKDKYGTLLCLLSERQVSQISRVRSQHPFHDIGIIVMEMGGFVITIVTQSPHSLSARSSSPASSVSSPLTGTMQIDVKLPCAPSKRRLFFYIEPISTSQTKAIFKQLSFKKSSSDIFSYFLFFKKFGNEILETFARVARL